MVINRMMSKCGHFVCTGYGQTFTMITSGINISMVESQQMDANAGCKQVH